MKSTMQVTSRQIWFQSTMPVIRQLCLGSIANCPVLLGSATPSIESMYNAKTGKYNLLELPERIDNAKLPVITLVDVKKERMKTENGKYFF